jgi:hypothetical protein
MLATHGLSSAPAHGPSYFISKTKSSSLSCPIADDGNESSAKKTVAGDFVQHRSIDVSLLDGFDEITWEAAISSLKHTTADEEELVAKMLERANKTYNK